MSIQAQFDKEAIDYLTNVKMLLKSYNRIDANTLYNYALRRILNSRKALIDMNKEEIEAFDNEIIEGFHCWVSE